MRYVCEDEDEDEIDTSAGWVDILCFTNRLRSTEELLEKEESHGDVHSFIYSFVDQRHIA
jgi:hypothetical protein